jgi:Ribbon-helix-helix protein, copG family
MARINIYGEHTHDDGYADTHLEGWFDPDTAHRFAEGTNFTGSQRGHEALYRTSGGRWVRHHWSQWEGSPETYVFMSDGEAKDWLIRSEVNDDALEKHFGDIPEESAPVGRPREGTLVGVRVPDADLAALDEEAALEGVSRAQLIRAAIAARVSPARAPETAAMQGDSNRRAGARHARFEEAAAGIVESHDRSPEEVAALDERLKRLEELTGDRET